MRLAFLLPSALCCAAFAAPANAAMKIDRTLPVVDTPSSRFRPCHTGIAAVTVSLTPITAAIIRLTVTVGAVAATVNPQRHTDGAVVSRVLQR